MFLTVNIYLKKQLAAHFCHAWEYTESLRSLTEGENCSLLLSLIFFFLIFLCPTYLISDFLKFLRYSLQKFKRWTPRPPLAPNKQ